MTWKTIDEWDTPNQRVSVHSHDNGILVRNVVNIHDPDSGAGTTTQDAHYSKRDAIHLRDALNQAIIGDRLETP